RLRGPPKDARQQPRPDVSGQGALGARPAPRRSRRRSGVAPRGSLPRRLSRALRPPAGIAAGARPGPARRPSGPGSACRSDIIPRMASHGSLEIVPLGGLGEFGMHIMAFSAEDAIIVVDCGILFPE